MSKQVLFTPGVVEGAMVRGRECLIRVPRIPRWTNLQNFYTRVRFYGILTGDLRIHRRRCQSLDVLWLP